ncbi:MAG TPA: hypothetical protein G4O08_02480 [Anaerolineae bacterium]|nr:hypothetical protein [Anaerolineae bacterium]
MSTEKVSSAKRSFSISTILLWILVVALIALSTITLLKLIEARKITHQTVAQAADLLAALEDLRIEQTVAIQEDIPISVVITIDETLEVPVQTDVEIEHETTIPVNVAPYGTINVTIPIETTIPIDMTFDIPMEITVPVETTVPVDMLVPISIDLSETALHDILAQARAALAEAAEYLSGSIFP